MRTNIGFTLLEIIVSLFLFSILAAVAGSWLVMGTMGYQMTRENVSITEKAQLATWRLSRELQEMTALDVVNSDGGCLVYRVDELSPYFRAIVHVGDDLVLKSAASADCLCTSCEGSAAHTLTDQVDRFEVTYENQDGTVSSTPVVLADLKAVHVEIDLTRTDSETRTHAFNFTINPRNNLYVSAP
jgi:prepilin-type N-terminal cleavage/methylation domain-containing protein